MAMNRRNVLIGLGTVAAGGGAALGTGAFSQVTADRSVTVETSGDAAGALLGLSAGTGTTGIVSTEGSGEGETIIQFNESNLNGDATTTWSQALQVTNNGDDDVDFFVQSASGLAPPLNFIENGGSSVVGSGQSITIASGASTQIDIKVDLTGNNDASSIPSTVTFNASKTTP